MERKRIKVYPAQSTFTTCCKNLQKYKHLELGQRNVALISNQLYFQGVPLHTWRLTGRWQMEGCGVPPKRAGITGKRWAITLVTEYHILDSLCGKDKKKKNYRANLTSSINDFQHDQKESESSNVKPADRYIEKKKIQDWGHVPWHASFTLRIPSLIWINFTYLISFR